MNKKLILGIIAGVVALALIIVAAVVIIDKFVIDDGGSSSGLPSTSDVSGTDDKDNSSAGNTESTIQGGDFGIGSAEGAVSDTVKVDITISENPGFFAGQYFFTYDAEALEYVGFEEGEIFEGGEYTDNASDAGTVNFIINGKELKDVKKSGNLVTLEFKIKDSAKKGDYAIALGKETIMCTVDEVVVEPKISEGKITVK